jgi:hypothetical protein
VPGEAPKKQKTFYAGSAQGLDPLVFLTWLMSRIACPGNRPDGFIRSFDYKRLLIKDDLLPF